MPEDIPQQEESEGTTVPSEHLLWRRIPQQFYLEDGNSESGYRISTQAFSNTSGTKGMSATNGTEAREQGRTENHIFEAFPKYDCLLLAEFSVGLAEELNQSVIREPVPEEPCHCEVVGSKTKSVKKSFAKESERIHRPG